MKRFLACVAFGAATALLPAQSAFNVDFGSPDTPAHFSGTALAPGSGTIWTNITATGGPVSLLDTQGNASAVTLQLSGFSFWYGGGSYSGGPLATTYANLMFDYAYVGIAGIQGTGTVRFENLNPGTTYNLHLYSQGDSIDQGGRFTLTTYGAADQTALNIGTSDFSAFSEGNNFVVFRNVRADSSGVLQLQIASNLLSSYGALNGLQLTAGPEPSTYAALAGAAALGFAFWRRRRPSRTA